MKKNGFLTFIFACIPGAGQMYYGYMQRGLSIVMMLILCLMAATVVEPLMFLCLDIISMENSHLARVQLLDASEGNVDSKACLAAHR